jgi:hypothetical protein
MPSTISGENTHRKNLLHVLKWKRDILSTVHRLRVEFMIIDYILLYYLLPSFLKFTALRTESSHSTTCLTPCFFVNILNNHRLPINLYLITNFYSTVQKLYSCPMSCCLDNFSRVETLCNLHASWFDLSWRHIKYNVTEYVMWCVAVWCNSSSQWW